MAASNGGWKLTTAKKKDILVNNIHGVDIDAQAVEVTKLSLLLKVLEEESGQLSLGLERVLPDLGRNIQCGNSLIGEDYFAGQLIVDEKERQRVNPFDWERSFPSVFKNGGFNVVIGNPPYVRQEALGNDKQYFQKHYEVYAGTADLYSYFIEKGASLLAPGGQFSYIVANKWMRANYGEALRKWMKTKCIEEITDFGDLPVFENATTYPCIINISNKKPHFKPRITVVKTLTFASLQEFINDWGTLVDQTSFSDNGWSLAQPEIQNISTKINHNAVPLNKFINGNFYYGIKTGLNEAFVIDKETHDKLLLEDPNNSELIKPFIIGRDIKKYKYLQTQRYLILIPKGWTKEKSKNSTNGWRWFQHNYSALANYLEPFAQNALKRSDQGDYWWELRACDYYQEFEKGKIIYPNICKQPEFTVDSEKLYSNQKCFIISVYDFYLLGILNSKLMMFFFRTTIPKLRGDFYEPGYAFMKNFPVHSIDFSKPTEVKQHDRMVALVERMLELHKRTPSPLAASRLGGAKIATTPQEQERLTRDIASTDREIDKLVYELYGLSDEEIKIVEGN